MQYFHFFLLLPLTITFSCFAPFEAENDQPKGKILILKVWNTYKTEEPVKIRILDCCTVKDLKYAYCYDQWMDLNDGSIKSVASKLAVYSNDKKLFSGQILKELPNLQEIKKEGLTILPKE